MPLSFERAIAAFVSFWIFAHAAGHPEWIWKGLAHVQAAALQEARRPWGNPSISGQRWNWDQGFRGAKSSRKIKDFRAMTSR